MNQEELTLLFEKLGASEPEDWARSQTAEGINQLGRYLFLRQAWRSIVDENDRSWIEAGLSWSTENRGATGSGIGPALQRLMDRGVNPQDITDVVRVMQYKLLFRLCYLLSDPSFDEPELENFCWALVQVDDRGKVVDSIDALHQSVLETDPTGREMRPRNEGA